MTVFKGLSAFPITPADGEGRIMLPDLRRILRHVAEGRPDSICVLGSTGAYAYLDPDQRRAVAEAAMDQVGSRVPVIVGVGALRTDTAVDLARHAARIGAAGLLVAPMSYTPLTEDEVFHHFAAIAAASDLPICIYNNPGTTHFTFSTALLARLATLPTVRAVKMPLVASGGAGTAAHFIQVFRDAGYQVKGGFEDGVMHMVFSIDPTVTSLAVMQSRLVNGGFAVKPHLTRQIERGAGEQACRTMTGT